MRYVSLCQVNTLEREGSSKSFFEETVIAEVEKLFARRFLFFAHEIGQ